MTQVPRPDNNIRTRVEQLLAEAPTLTSTQVEELGVLFNPEVVVVAHPACSLQAKKLNQISSSSV